MGTIWKVLTRKKVIDPVTAEETQLARRLNTFDLTALGVGSTLGVGVYVLAGHVAKSVAGPSVVLSFLIAAVASVFAGLCYAEFGARVPRAGSAYIYSYVCVGEFVAFIIGWNLILEYVIGSASVAKGLSLYLDTLINNTLQTTFREIAPIDVPFMAKYFDFLSFGISVLLAIALAFGMKESSLANNIFTSLNIGVVLFVVVAGSLKADTANWSITPDNSTNSTMVGKGGFFPFGLEGTITGAATCFYGFVGFDCIATTGEEVKNPKKAIPLSIILSLMIIFLAYFGISTVVTLMVPYYLQDPNAPIPYAFEHIGWNWAKWIVAIGGIFGLCASLFGAMFPLPRIIYAMANDSLLFKFLGRVSSRFQTPVIGTLLAGTLTGLMAALFELNQLVNMMSIGTLMAYTIVAASVLLLRFSMDDKRIAYIPVRNHSDSEDSESYSDNMATFTVNNSINDDSELLNSERRDGGSSTIGQIFNCGRHSEPTNTSQSLVAIEVFLYCVICLLIGLSAIYLKHPLVNGEIWAIVLVSCIIFAAAILLMSIATQPVSRKELNFKVPMVPLIPALSILANIYLMLMLDFHTWIRFAVWMALDFPLGLPTYYFSLRPVDEQPTKLPLDHKLTERNTYKKQNGLANYYTNNGFVEDTNNDTEYQSETTKKKTKERAPQPPKIDDKSDVIEIQQELKKFDEMLDQVANTLERNRKPSVGSVSVSDVVLREENVVADVHCVNVTPAIPSSTNEYPTENVKSSELQTKSRQSPPTTLNLNENQLKKNVLKRAGSIDSPVPPDTPLSFVSASVSDQDLTEASPFNLTPCPTPPTSPLTTPKILNETPYTPPPSPLTTPKILNETPSYTLPPPPLPQELPTTLEDTKNTRETLPRVTSNKIKEVTLRPTKKREENVEKQFEPDDDNIQIGSERAKSFIENLNKKLTNIIVVPTYSYVVPSKKGPAPQPPQYKKNENVIEESIDKNEAKEKLGLFVNSRISHLETENKENLEKPKIDAEAPISNNQTEENYLENEHNNLTENPDDKDAFLAHQSRMKGVFRSMKSVEPSKEQPSMPSRNAKTLDHRPVDETQHKQAMNEIFKTIQLRRKESSVNPHSAI